MSKVDSAKESKTLNFLVQISQNIGVGHLTRSAAVTSNLIKQGLNVQLTLISDSYGRKVAKTLGIPFSESLPDSTGLVVVDAIEINEVEAAWVSLHHLRLIISPVFNRFDLATHVIVRDLPKSMKELVPDSVDLVVDDSYAFVTSQEVEPVRRSYSELLVGICLTGGTDFINLEPLLEELVSVEGLKEVRLISNNHPRLPNRCDISFSRSGFVNNPWEYMQPINFFVGGEGVMISESVARGIPAVSLLLNRKTNKNRNLIESGAVKIIDREPLDVKALSRLLSDSSALETMHQQAMKFALLRKQNSLPNKILEIFSSSKKNRHVDSRSYC